jgi:hypothetical protein
MAYSDIEPLLGSTGLNPSLQQDVSRLAAAAASERGVVSNRHRDRQDRRETDSEDIESHYSSAFELHTSPDGAVRFVDELGDALLDLPPINLGSLVKSAFIVQRPISSAVRTGTPKFRKLDVVRRMNGGDEQTRREGTVIVQSAGSILAADGEKVSRGVFAIEVPFVESEEEREERIASERGASSLLLPEDSMYLCPPVGAGTLGSKDNDLCVQQTQLSDSDDDDDDETFGDNDGDYLPVQPLSTLHMMPPKAVTSAVGSSRGIGSSIRQISAPHVADRFSPRDKTKSQPASPIRMVPTTPLREQRVEQLCVSPSQDFLTSYDTCPNFNFSECTPFIRNSPVMIAQPISVVVPVLEPVLAPRSNDIRGEHKLLPAAYEGRIFGPLRIDPASQGGGAAPELGLSTKMTRVTPLVRLFRSVKKMAESQWFVPVLLVVFVFIVAAIGPNNHMLAAVLDWLLGKSAAELQANAQAVAMLQRQHPVLLVPSTPPRLDNVPQHTSQAFVSAPSTPFIDPAAVLETQEVDETGRKVTRIGSLVVYADSVLGYGSHGTVVFQGGLNGRPVAVKRMLSHCRKSADR